jgi:hypothetical protein
VLTNACGRFEGKGKRGKAVGKRYPDSHRGTIGSIINQIAATASQDFYLRGSEAAAL